MFPRSPVLQPALRAAIKPRQFQVHSRRAFADKEAPVAPVSGQPRDFTSRFTLFIAAGLVAWFPFYYFSHTSKNFASEQKTIKEARRSGDPSKETRDPRDSSVKTLEQKKARDGVDHFSESKKQSRAGDLRESQ